MRRNPTVDAVIPVYRPDVQLTALLDALMRQSVRPSHVLILNADERYWKEELVKDHPEAEVFHIAREDYRHGTVHNTGAGFAEADIVLYMTQDALPADDRMISKLIRPFRNEEVKAVYARQIPESRSGIMDGYEQTMFFPEESEIRNRQDLKENGRVAMFCSNICAAYDLETFRILGGFPEGCIADEDVLYAGELIRKGFGVAYVSGAAVYRTIRYSNMECFRKSFDSGVAWASHPEITKGIRLTRNEEGFQRVASQLEATGKQSYYPRFRAREFLRSFGFFLGRHYKALPEGIVKACSNNRRYWSQNKHKSDLH